ncbi:MAG TPA: hypothetical protein VFA52_04300 [Candidatus Paceibacterota bacterium]|jgi:hypothetical protein|nr:hypothetical protein [Candidatus Paceibacterota bacterium]
MKTQYSVSEEVRAAVEHLIQVGVKHKMLVAGFVFSANPPSIINFGNCTDYSKASLYNSLCELAERQRNSGHFCTETVGVVQ